MKKVLVVLGILFGVGLLAVLITNGVLKDEKKVEKKKAPVVIKEATSKWLFAGTTFWGRRTNKNARASELGVKYPFSQLDTLSPEKYDAWIAGLECPVTNNGHNDVEENTIFKFR